jgi:hypothetical protein
MIAFAVSLVRDRLYAQDYSDVEYVLAGLSGTPMPPSAKATPTGDAKAAATEVSHPGTAAAATAVLPTAAATGSPAAATPPPAQPAPPTAQTPPGVPPPPAPESA